MRAGAPGHGLVTAVGTQTTRTRDVLSREHEFCRVNPQNLPNLKKPEEAKRAVGRALLVWAALGPGLLGPGLQTATRGPWAVAPADGLMGGR